MKEIFFWNKYTDENGVEQIEKVDEVGNKFYVPIDETNSDYKAYLESLNESKSK